MRLEDLTIALRPRQPWEAVDLGCTLVRRDYGQILSLWLLSVMPLWILLAVALRDHPGWFGFAVWWLKPLYDRLPLYHLSRAAFGARPTLKQSLREWPRLWSRFLLSALLFRRLSFIRSFALPVWMLEGQRGRAVGKRLKALATDGGGSGSSLTWVFVKLELAVFFGITFLVSNIGPSNSLPDWSDFFQNPEAYLEVTPAQQWATNLIYMLAMTLVEPFYVGGGFGLYLNSRTKIEGWDIELTFRRMAERLRPAAMVGVLLWLVCAPALLHAQQPHDDKEVQATLQEVLSRPEFKEHSRTQSMWVPDNLSGGPGAPALEWLGPVFYGIGISLLGVLIYFVVRWAMQNRHIFDYSGGLKNSGPQGPRILMGMDIASENLPDDIVGAARAAWAAGRLREAVSLLYRGSLSRLVEQQRLPIRDSDTEDDCLQHVAQAGDGPVTSFFRQLTLVWVRAAYAGREAQAPEFDRLCSTWPFPPPSAGKRQSSAVAVKGAVVMLLVMPLLAGCSGHWEEITIPQGYKGKARSDPFLAAQELLEAYGHSTQRLPVLKAFPDSANGVILVSGESGMPEARARQLLEWVDQGGHLIYTMAGCAPYNDWGLFSSLSTLGYEGSKDRADPVLEGLGVTVLGWGDLDKLKETLSAGLEKDKREKQAETDKEEEKPDTVNKDGVVKRIEEPRDVPTTRSQIRMGKKTFAVDFPDMLHFALHRSLGPAEYASGTADKAVCLSLVHGYGRVTLLNHARPLRSRYLDENDHALWLLALVGEDSQEVQFIVSLQRSFWELLWKRAWMPVVGLVFLIAIWLWRSLPRFGPLRQAVLHETRHFADHIGALGQFFYRIRQSRILLTAAGDVVRTRAVRKHPHLAHQDDEALVEMLVGISSLPKDRIRAAFEVPEKPAAHQMVRQLQDLQALREAL